MLKIKFDLFNYPNRSFIAYQIIGNLLFMVISYFVSLSTSSEFYTIYFGYFFGSLAVTIGFYIITVHATKIVRETSTEKGAKMSSYVYLILRIIIYALITILAIKYINVSILTLFIGFLSIKFVIYVDHFVNK